MKAFERIPSRLIIDYQSAIETLMNISFLLSKDDSQWDPYSALETMMKQWNVANPRPHSLCLNIALFAAAIHHNVRDLVPALQERGFVATVIGLVEGCTENADPKIRMFAPPLLQALNRSQPNSILSALSWSPRTRGW